MNSRLQKLLNVYRHNGTRATITFLLARLGLIDDTLRQVKTAINQEVFERFNGIVQFGPFEGLELNPKGWWGLGSRGNQVLGLYEDHIVEILCDFLKSEKSELFIDIGAADGFFAVGVLKAGLTNRCVAYEVSERGREALRETAKLNGVDSKLVIEGVACKETLKSYTEGVEKAVILCDIEGAEYNLFDNQIVEQLSKQILVIELHPHKVMDGDLRNQQLFGRLEKVFEVEVVGRRTADLTGLQCIDGWPDDARYLLLSEGRDVRGQWAVCFPKQSINQTEMNSLHSL